MKTVWLCAEAHHRQTKRPFFCAATIQSKAKQRQSEASFMYHPKLQSVSSAGVYVRICVCLLQPEPQSRSFIICFQLRFDSLHEQAIHIRTRATTRQSHTIYLYCYTHSPQTVAVITMIKVFQLQATQSAV